MSGMGKQPTGDFVPAAPQLWAYDLLSFLLTRARQWRPALLEQVAPSGVARGPNYAWWHKPAHRSP
jgi:hypothetical protein